MNQIDLSWSRLNVEVQNAVQDSWSPLRSLPFHLAAAAQMPDKPIARPKITGISHLAVYTSNPAAAEHYYREIVGAAKVADPENPQGVRYAINATQFIEVLPLPRGRGHQPAGPHRL